MSDPNFVDNSSLNRIGLLGDGSRMVKLLTSLSGMPPTPIYHGKKEPKPQRMGGPVLSSKRLWRLRKQSVNQVK